jgi:hypothetical protein
MKDKCVIAITISSSLHEGDISYENYIQLILNYFIIIIYSKFYKNLFTFGLLLIITIIN